MVLLGGHAVLTRAVTALVIATLAMAWVSACGPGDPTVLVSPCPPGPGAALHLSGAVSADVTRICHGVGAASASLCQQGGRSASDLDPAHVLRSRYEVVFEVAGVRYRLGIDAHAGQADGLAMPWAGGLTTAGGAAPGRPWATAEVDSPVAVWRAGSGTFNLGPGGEASLDAVMAAPGQPGSLRVSGNFTCPDVARTFIGS